MVWYSRLFQNFPQFIVIHTVKGFGTVLYSSTLRREPEGGGTPRPGGAGRGREGRQAGGRGQDGPGGLGRCGWHQQLGLSRAPTAPSPGVP